MKTNLMGIGKFLVTVLMVMVGIYVLKMIIKKTNIPVLSTVAEAV